MDDYIFISYSRLDENEVRNIYQKLTDAGYNCWLDVDKINSGSDWDKVLQKAIENCSQLVVICTPTSMSSRNVSAEWQYAFDLKKTIHPFILKSCQVPFRLRIYQHIDSTELGLDEAIQKLIQNLPTRVSTSNSDTDSEDFISKIHSLIFRSVQNWRSFGILLDRAAFDYVDNSRDELQELNSTTCEFMYLSVRKLTRHVADESNQYWASRVKDHSSATDSVENTILDEINERWLYESQIELELFASAKLISKITRMITISDNLEDISLLLDSSIRMITKLTPHEVSLEELEDSLYQKMRSTSDPVFARALGWLNSAKILQDIKSKFDDNHPQSFDEIEFLTLITLVNMQNSEATKLLERLTPQGFVFIPAGWFLMGSNNGHDYSGSPQHEAFVPSFWLRKIPLTQKEFKSQHLLPLEEVIEEFPAHYISWHMATTWIQEVAKQTNLPLSLPSEAMWEKAASWNPNTGSKQRFPWGNESDPSRCNTIESNRGKFTPVGFFNQGASAYGILDMVGNVWEWTTSPFLPYPYSSRYERSSKSKPIRVMRGPSQDARRGLDHGCMTRIGFDDGYSFDNAGMRVAIVVDV